MLSEMDIAIGKSNLDVECPTNCYKAIKVLLDDKAGAQKDMVEKLAYIKSLEDKLTIIEMKSSISNEKVQVLSEKIKDKDDVITTLKSSIEMYKTMKTAVIKPDEIIDHILALKDKLSQLTETKVHHNIQKNTNDSNIVENIGDVKEILNQKEIQISNQKNAINQKNETITKLQNELKTTNKLQHDLKMCQHKIIVEKKLYKSKVANYENTIKQLRDKQEAATKNPPGYDETNVLIKKQQTEIDKHLKKIEVLKMNLNSVKTNWDLLRDDNNEYKRDNLIYKNQVIQMNKNLTNANATLTSNERTIKELKSTIAKLQEKSKTKPKETMGTSLSFELMQIEGLKPFVAAYDDLMDCVPKWMIIHRRMDGSISFDRFWTDYCTGFGNNNGEFWLGLEKLHVLTGNQRHELYIHFTDLYNQVRYARYDNFKIASEAAKYKLNSLGSYTGNTGDIMRKYENHTFDIHDSSGGWWYTKAQEFHLNGEYIDQKSKDQEHGLCLGDWYYGSSVSLKSVRMLIRPHDKN